ncbi:MAG: nucleoside monophosphate kinase, partial [bacterium]|nr:nucleoside monophosphate kinase [bacterium]
LRALSKEDSPLGRQLKAFTETGRLAPPPMVVQLVTDHILKFLRDGRPVALEGSPRTLYEAETLLGALRTDGIDRMLVVFLDVPKPQTVQRILERWVCEGCKCSTTHPVNTPEGCTDCGGTLVRRADDTAEVAEKRWKEYTFRTLPVVRFFERQGLVARVNGDRPIPEVTDEVRNIVRERIGL